MIPPAKPDLFFSLNRDLVWGFLLAAATLLAYRPAWNGKPVWDDDAHMTKPELRSVSGLVRIWTQPDATQQYYPLAHSVFWLEHRFFGDSTPGYHLLNILLHFFSALLLATILRRIGIPGAWLAGALFALHPVQVESVAWISELKNTLSGFFFLSAALAYLKFDHAREKKHYTIALIFFVCGLSTKSVIVTLPATLLVVFWWKRGKIYWKRDVVPLLPFFFIGIISGVFTAWVERRFIGAEGSEFNLAFIDRCLIAGRAVWFYLYKLIWPANLIFIYPRWRIDSFAVWQYVFPAVFLLAAALFWVLRIRSRAPLAVLLYFTITLSPALGFFNVFPFRYSFVADHFQYLACIGPITAAAACIEKGTGFLKEKFGVPTGPLLSCTLLSVLFMLSWKQSVMYSDAETLYRTTLTKNDCWWAHNNLALLFSDTGRTGEAMVHYLKAIEIKPNFPEAHNNLGLLLADAGRADDALGHVLKALEIKPDFGDAHYNAGVSLDHMGRTDEAMAHYMKALELNSNRAEAHYNLGILLSDRGRTDEAMAHYQKVLEIKPDHADAHNNLGILFAKTGRTDVAMAHFRKAMELRPDTIRFLKNYAVALAQKGQLTDATSVLEKALGSAKSAGDAARTKKIMQILSELKEAADVSQEHSKTHAQ